jgi:plasmid stabilization system protein ParE
VVTLATMPERGRMVPELDRVGERRYRELIELPWRVIYRVKDESVRVVAVIDSRRDLQTWLQEQAARFRKSTT